MEKYLKFWKCKKKEIAISGSTIYIINVWEKNEKHTKKREKINCFWNRQTNEQFF